MSEDSKSKTDYSSFLSMNWLTIQTVMLFCHYGLQYEMPKWVIWFPSIVFGSILTIVGIVGLIILIVAITKE